MSIHRRFAAITVAAIISSPFATPSALAGPCWFDIERTQPAVDAMASAAGSAGSQPTAAR
jgi:hypothetical protein